MIGATDIIIATSTVIMIGVMIVQMTELMPVVEAKTLIEIQSKQVEADPGESLYK